MVTTEILWETYSIFEGFSAYDDELTEISNKLVEYEDELTEAGNKVVRYFVLAVTAFFTIPRYIAGVILAINLFT